MYILLPYVVFVLTLIVMAIVVELYYKCKKHLKSKNTKTKKATPSWWKDPYWYLSIIGFIIIGLIAYLASLVTITGLGYLLMLLNDK